MRFPRVNNPAFARYFRHLLLLAVLPACYDNSVEEHALSTSQLRARRLNNQGVVYMDQHNYSRGHEAFAEAVSLAPRYATGHTNLGIAHYSLGQYDSAAAALKTAISQSDCPLNARYVLGLIYNVQGHEYEKALAYFVEVGRTDPDDPLIHYYRGQVLSKLGRHNEALQHYRHAVRIDPHGVSAHYAMANLFRKTGRQSEANATLREFQRLTQAGYEGLSQAYQGQGKYAEAVTDVPPSSEKEGRPLTPVFQHSTERVPEHRPNYATLVDFDSDGDLDLVTGRDMPIVHNRTMSGYDESHAIVTDFTLESVRQANFADWDNDGDPDIVLSGTPTVIATQDTGRFTLHSSLPAALGSNFADLDHDGDCDLLQLSSSGPSLWTNDGEGTFSNITTTASINMSHIAQQAVFSDLDNDRDIDLLLVSSEGLRLFTNNRDGTFGDLTGSMGLDYSSVAQVVVEDIDGDSFNDLVLLYTDGRLELLSNQEGRSFEGGKWATPATEDTDRDNHPRELMQKLKSLDYDNDGDVDLALCSGDRIRLFANVDNSFEPMDPVLGMGEPVGNLITWDFDANGTTDLWADGHLLLNQLKEHRWLEIELQGTGSNRDGIGTKVEVRTTQGRQKREIRGDAGNGRILRFGIAGQDSVEFVRLLWPSGVRQSELAAAANQRLTLTELNRKGTSCPILYAWNGNSFQFVTDILGGAIIGYLTAPGQYNTPDTDEYVAIDHLKAKDGTYLLQIANQLEEVIYLDAVELVVVDHAPHLEVHVHERLLTSPPYPEFRLLPLENLRPPHQVRDHQGTDVTNVLRKIDNIWYEDFERTDIHGYARDHGLVVDLGDLSQTPHPILLLYGWVDYAHSSSNWAASQRGWTLRPPRLEVPDGLGGWRVAYADMGTPAGLPKYMAVDLDGFFSGIDNRVRISTNTAVYWDQLLVGNHAGTEFNPRRLQAISANLHWRGYPAHSAINGTFAFRYHYDQVARHQDWGTHRGAFTRIGEIGELLRAVDDRYAILRHGDELTLAFSATTMPPLTNGFRRRFFLYADGFGKDMDFHSARSLTVEPLPFHSMSSYPYPEEEHYPHSRIHLDYLLNYNTRRTDGHY